MHRGIVALFCIIFVVDVRGASLKTPASIDKDAIETARLVEQLWSFKPAILKRTKPLIYCQIIDQCCEDEDRLKGISLMNPLMSNNGVDSFENVMERCMNTTTSNKENQQCPVTIKSIIPSWTIFRNLDVKKYMDIVKKYMNKLEKVFEDTTFVCNSEEIHAFTCLSNTKLVESCAGKILQELYDYDYKNYQNNIKYIKQTLIDANQELVRVFIKNTNTN